MAELHKITRILNTRADLAVNLKVRQIAIESDGNGMLSWNDNVGNYHVAADQLAENGIGENIFGTTNITGNLLFEPSSTRTVKPKAPTGTSAGGALTVEGGNATTSGDGGALSINGGEHAGDNETYDDGLIIIGADHTEGLNVQTYTTINNSFDVNGTTTINGAVFVRTTVPSPILYLDYNNADNLGYPSIKYAESSTIIWSQGLDTANGNRYVITPNTTIAGRTDFCISTTGNIGIGIAPGATTAMNVYRTYSNSSYSALAFQVLPTFSIAGSYSTTGISAVVTTTLNANNTSVITGALIQNLIGNGNYTATAMTGLNVQYGNNDSSGSGTIKELRGINITPFARVGVVEKHYGIYINDVYIAGGGSVTGDNFSIYSLHDAPAQFVHDVRIHLDNKKFTVGAGDNAGIYYLSNMVINTRLVGSGNLNVINGDVLIGGYAGSVASSKLEVEGTITANPTNGSANGATYLSVDGSSNGLFVAKSSAGVTKMSLGATDGSYFLNNIVIGANTTASHKLEIVGGGLAYRPTDGSTNGLTLIGSSADNAEIDMFDATGNQDGLLNPGLNTSYFVGNLCIGANTNASHKLEVVGGAAIRPYDGDEQGKTLFGIDGSDNAVMEMYDTSTSKRIDLQAGTALTSRFHSYTALGGSAPGIKMAKFTGTTASSSGASVTVAHGLTASKILSVEVIVYDGGTNYILSNTEAGIGNSNFEVWFNSTNIVVYNRLGLSGSIYSKAFTILITYEA